MSMALQLAMKNETLTWISSLSDPGARPYSPPVELVPLKDLCLSKLAVLPILPDLPFPIGSGKLLS